MSKRRRLTSWQTWTWPDRSRAYERNTRGDRRRTKKSHWRANLATVRNWTLTSRACEECGRPRRLSQEQEWKMASLHRASWLLTPYSPPLFSEMGIMTPTYLGSPLPSVSMDTSHWAGSTTERKGWGTHLVQVNLLILSLGHNGWLRWSTPVMLGTEPPLVGLLGML